LIDALTGNDLAAIATRSPEARILRLEDGDFQPSRCKMKRTRQSRVACADDRYVRIVRAAQRRTRALADCARKII
jgi:hypothetical protein